MQHCSLRSRTLVPFQVMLYFSGEINIVSLAHLDPPINPLQRSLTDSYRSPCSATFCYGGELPNNVKDTPRLHHSSLFSQVLDAHCGFLSNFEVLQLLQEDVAEQDVHVKALKQEFEELKKKKKRNYQAAKAEPYLDFQDQLGKIVPHNVRTLQVEVSLALECPANTTRGKAFKENHHFTNF